MAANRVTGNSLATELQNGIFTPFSLSNTSYPSTPALPASYAHGYFIDPASDAPIDTTAIDPSMAAGAGAIISTVEDMRVWIEALGRGSLLDAETQAERLVMNPAGEGYDAYGFGIARIGDWIGHDGVFPLSYQSAGFYDPFTD
jgi:D-alanyl-D-alanine carboxypeptidase